MTVGGIVGAALFIADMAFTTSDRDDIRDIFGYSWSYNDFIDDLLSSAFSEYGDTVVTAVRGYVRDIESIQATVDAEMGEPELERQEIHNEATQVFRTGGALARNNAQINRLKQQIRAAIDPYNQLYAQTATPLLRS